MERRDAKAQILNILAKSIRRIMEKEAVDFSGLQEIRLRVGQPVRILLRNREKVLQSPCFAKKRGKNSKQDLKMLRDGVYFFYSK